MSFAPRVTSYWDWDESRLRDELARLENMTPDWLRKLSAGEKQRRTAQIRDFRKELASRSKLVPS